MSEKNGIFQSMTSPRSIILFALFLTLSNCQFLNDLEGKVKSNSFNIDDRLFVSKYIERGDTETARRLSRCGDLPNAQSSLESYSGFITVRKNYNSNIFFWFFPAVNKNPSAPVLLWLQGGPGDSGLMGLFLEHGPYMIQANMTATLREHHWARTFHMIYVDNPVGAGFSFTEDERGFVTNQNEMAEDMYEFLRQFFTLFQEYKNNDFYIAGESYGGKYAPSLAHKIHSMGASSVVKLTGMMIGNGLCHPETMFQHSEYLYNIGLLDDKQAKTIKKLEDRLTEDIKNEDYLGALNRHGELFSNLRIYTGYKYFYNSLMVHKPVDMSYYLDYIRLPQLKRALKIGNLEYQNGDTLFRYLIHDIAKSAKPNITVIMDNYKVLIYHGQLDAMIPYPSVLKFLNSVEWKYAEEYKSAVRKIWYLKNSKEIAGYVHKAGDFYEVLVRNAGHMVAYDQTEFAFDLVSRFVNNEAYY